MITSVGNKVPNAVHQLTILCLAFIASFSAIAYELILASYATFLFGASVFQYTLVISVMMASMGIGSYLSKFFKSKMENFIVLEWLLAVVAVLAIPVLYGTFSHDLFPKVFLLVFVVLIGGFIGLEIPLLNTFLAEKSLSQVLFSDYVGGFIGGILYPLWWLPNLGFFQTAALLASLNALAALTCAWYIKKRVGVSLLFFLLTLFYFVQSEFVRIQMESYFLK